MSPEPIPHCGLTNFPAGMMISLVILCAMSSELFDDVNKNLTRALMLLGSTFTASLCRAAIKVLMFRVLMIKILTELKPKSGMIHSSTAKTTCNSFDSLFDSVVIWKFMSAHPRKGISA